MQKPEAKDVRQAFSDYRSEWQDIYDDGDEDMRYVAGDPWSEEDRKAREAAGRPCLSLDEINQYLNQYCNNLRQSPRSIRLTPKGDGADDQSARRRSSLVRGIEEESNAQLAYITAAECAASRGYGFSVIRTEYKDETSFDQVLRIRPIQNPDTVLLNPNYKNPDASDVTEAFLLDRITKESFKSKYKDAKITDFSSELMSEIGVSDWIAEKTVQIAEYWRMEYDQKKLLLVAMQGGLQIFTEDDFKKIREQQFSGLPAPEVKRERTIETPRILQYLTNGVEMLDEIPWAGSRVPITACFGKELFLNQGGKAVRKLMSLVRLARDPQMLFAYLATQECEEAGQIPKVPFVGAVGQFETDKDAWGELHQVPHPYVQYDIIIDGASGVSIPPPSRPQYTPNFEQYEIAKDSARRSIQAAMGIMPLPTAAQQRNEKSGVALDRIHDTEQVGSFHFSDNYSRYLRNNGFQINELLDPIYDTAREEPIQKPDGTASTMHIVGKTSHPITDEGAYEVQGLPEDHYHTGTGKFGVTIDDGPNFDSEREEQSEFVDHLITNWQQLAIPGPIANKILAKAIRMKNLGPICEDIATYLDPPDPSKLTPEAQAIVAKLTGELQLLQKENTALHMDRAGRVLEQKTKVHIEDMRVKLATFEKNIDHITKIVVAQIAKQSKADQTQAQLDAQHELEQLGFGHDQIDRAHDSAAEVARIGLEHRNALELANQAHENSLEAGEQGHQQSLEQTAAAAALQPAESQPESGA